MVGRKFCELTLWETTNKILDMIYFTFVQALSVSFLFQRLSNRIWLNARASRIVCVMTSNRISRDWHFSAGLFNFISWFNLSRALHFRELLFLLTIYKNAMCLRSTDLPPDMMNCVLMVIAFELIFSSLKRHELETQSRDFIAVTSHSSTLLSCIRRRLVVWSLAWKFVSYLIMQNM